MSQIAHLLETWDIHDRIHHYLLAELSPDQLAAQAAGGKGRTVGEHFAHVHNVRRMWLSAARPELADAVAKLEKDVCGDRAALAAALVTSAAAIRELLATALGEGRVKGFKPHPAAFLGYLIAHESHHRGQIVLALKQAGLPITKKTSFGLNLRRCQ